MMSAMILHSATVSCIQTPKSLYQLPISLSRLIQTKNRGQEFCLNVVYPPNPNAFIHKKIHPKWVECFLKRLTKKL
mgnify:CR=1 FL=1